MVSFSPEGAIEHPNTIKMNQQKQVRRKQEISRSNNNALPDFKSLDSMHSELRNIRQNLQPLID
jgi:hypothetical protein